MFSAVLSFLYCLCFGYALSAEPEAQNLHRSKRHDFRFTVKEPYFYLDNHTLPFYDYFGAVTASHDHIRITPSSYGLKGSVWSKAKNPHKEWLLDVQIRIHGPGSVGGDGIALWYTRDRGVPQHLQIEKFPTAIDPMGRSLGPIFGSSDQWEGLGIFLDTFDKYTGGRNNPMVYGIMNDGRLKLENDHNPSTHKIGSCFHDYRNSARPKHIRIIYKDGQLEVWIDSNEHGGTHEICWSANVHLPTDYYFGVSASTDQLPDDQDLVSIDLYELKPLSTHDEKPAEFDSKFEEIRRQVEEARLKQDSLHQMHMGKDPGSSQLVRIEETQFNILKKLEDLANTKSAPASTGSSSADQSIVRTLEILSESSKRIESDMVSIHSMIKELASYVAGLSHGDKNDPAQFAKVLEQLSNKMDAVHNKADSIVASSAQTVHHVTNQGSSSWSLLGIFLLGQVVIMFAYGAWRSRQNEQSKKFI